MTNTNRLLKLLFCLFFMTLLAVHCWWGKRVGAFSTGPPPARTGAPGEAVCTVCHNSFQLNSGPGVLNIAGLPTSYSPNQEILVTVTLTQSNRELYGFQLTALDDAGQQAGTLIITDDSRTQRDSGIVGGNVRQYIEHTLAGTQPAAANQGSWAFKWKAPAIATGKVTFYAAGNAANGNGGLGGDYIYTTSAGIQSGQGEAGYEADVAPRPNGSRDGSVTVADWVQVGRFAAGLDEAAAGGEFQRADCAPAATRGDGHITISDWVQAGRYAAGLDPVMPAGGPSGLTSSLMPHGVDTNWLSASRGADALNLREGGALDVFDAGQCRRTVAVQLDAQGVENAVGFSLAFDPTQWRVVSAAPSNGATGATIIVNASGEAYGEVGIALALPVGQLFPTGLQDVAVVTFVSITQRSGSSQDISLADHPIRREVVDLSASICLGVQDLDRYSR